LVITFKNKEDGIKEVIRSKSDNSGYTLTKTAPENGYVNEMEFFNSLKTRKKRGIKENQNFIFRVRTGTDDNGKVNEAKYGKIHGQIRGGFKGPTKATVMFTYYFNPDGTRNIEFDLERNLFKSLINWKTMGRYNITEP